jgi:hypothetical protein
MRAAHLYIKNNTFDPMRCKDIPRRLVADIAPMTGLIDPSQAVSKTENFKTTTAASFKHPSSKDASSATTSVTSPQKLRRARQPHSLSKTSDLLIPQQLAAVAAHTAALVKERSIKDGDIILQIGSGRPLRTGRSPSTSLAPSAEKIENFAPSPSSATQESPQTQMNEASVKGSVVIEIDGNGHEQHNWSRHF